MALPLFASVEDWNNVSIIDTQYSTKGKANPKSRTRSYALNFAKSEFGILDKDGHHLKFDAQGSADALKLLRNTTKKDRKITLASVIGTKEGDIIHVQSLKIQWLSQGTMSLIRWNETPPVSFCPRSFSMAAVISIKTVG